jgi:hypothetical protein
MSRWLWRLTRLRDWDGVRRSGNIGRSVGHRRCRFRHWRPIGGLRGRHAGFRRRCLMVRRHKRHRQGKADPYPPEISLLHNAACRTRSGRGGCGSAAGLRQQPHQTRGDCLGFGSRIDTSVFSAITRGIAAKRVASSHGSTFIRASADNTLSRMPLASSQTDANRKASN